MKKVIAIMMILFPILLGCSHDSKSRIEKAFETFVSETYVDQKDFKGIKSIELVDSTDFFSMAFETLRLSEDAVSKMDSVTEVFKSTLGSASKSKVYTNKVQNELNSNIANLQEHKYEIVACKMATVKLRTVLDSVSNFNRYNKSYRLKTEFKSNPEYIVYYAQDFAFTDSIRFSKEPIKADEMPDIMKRVSILMQTIMEGCEYTIKHVDTMESAISMLKN